MAGVLGIAQGCRRSPRRPTQRCLRLPWGRAGSSGPGLASKSAAMVTTPPIIARAGPLLARYETIFCDVWGVLHDGRAAHVAAGAALARFRARGGTVVLVSNAPIPGE